MQTQKDQVQAHSFMMGRLSSALVEGDPTSAKIPGQRALNGLVIGIVIAVLVIGGFGVYGWLEPGGSKAYSQPGTIIVEKETGTRYVYLKGTLYPTPNLTSAMLLEGAGAQVKLISENSLKDVPRGPEIGIQDAPESVPTDLVAGPWLACLPGSVSANVNQGTKLGVDIDPRAPAAALSAHAFTVVLSGDGKTYLITGGKKYPIGANSVLAALGATNVHPAYAPTAWTDWLPTGVTLAPASIPQAGKRGPKIDGHAYPIGTLFRQQPVSGAQQLFVLRADGLAPISGTEALLASAANGTKPVTLDAAQVAAAPRSTDRSLLTRLPNLTRLHAQDLGGKVLCVRQRPASAKEVTSQVVLTSRSWSGVTGSGGTTVVAEPGTGMVVNAMPSASDKVQPELITDQGTAYRIGDPDSAAALGIDPQAAAPFPQTLLATLPQGPELSRSAVVRLAGR